MLIALSQVKRKTGKVAKWIGCCLIPESMKGLITERHFRAAEKWFPGIRLFYLSLCHKPATFLELVWEYEKAADRLPAETVVPGAKIVEAAGRQSR